MGKLKQIAGFEDPERFETITADADLFGNLREKVPDEPLIQLQPRKDNPGLEHGPELVRSLWHHRTDKYGRNVSPVNSFEIWFDEGEIRFYFHPDTLQQKNSGRKHFEDKFPGTRMEEESNPFPQINKGDYIAGAKMTLSNNFVRPLRLPSGPDAAAFSRDPFGSLTSDMVVENERTKTGQRVDSEDVRMVVQILFQPVSRKWSKGGFFGTDVNDYADELKQPKQKTGFDQTLRMIAGMEPGVRKPTAKDKKTARMVSELRGQPAYLFRLRAICISPYEDMAKQHAERVCEVFEMYDNPVTEQSLKTIPHGGDSLRRMLEKIASREMCYSGIAKLTSGKDLLSIPELAGMVHLPNESVETPEINWTTMQKGAGVPTMSPDLKDVDEKIAQERDSKQNGSEDQKRQPTPAKPGGENERWQDMGDGSLSSPEEEEFDLTIETGKQPQDIVDEERGVTETPADGRGLETDEVLRQDKAMTDENPTARRDGGQEESETEENEGGLLSGVFPWGDDGPSETDEAAQEPLPKSERASGSGGVFEEISDDDLSSIGSDWEDSLPHTEEQNAASPSEDEVPQSAETADAQQAEASEGADGHAQGPRTQDELPDAVLDQLDE